MISMKVYFQANFSRTIALSQSGPPPFAAPLQLPASFLSLTTNYSGRHSMNLTLESAIVSLTRRFQNSIRKTSLPATTISITTATEEANR